MVVHPSSSGEQKEAGIELIRALSSSLGVAIKENVQLDLGNGCTVEVDGYSDEPPILCEAWAHYGKPRGGQPHKIMTDAFKLVFTEKCKGKTYQKILLFCEEDSRKSFIKGSWQAQCLRVYDIKTEVYSLPTELECRVKKAQKRQYR